MTKENIIKNMTRALKVFAWEIGHYEFIRVPESNAREPWCDSIDDVYEVKRPHITVYVQYCDLENRIYIYRPIIRKYDKQCIGYQCSLSVYIGEKIVAEWVAELCLAISIMENEARVRG